MEVILQWLKTGVCEGGGRDVILQWLKTGVCEGGGGRCDIAVVENWCV